LQQSQLSQHEAVSFPEAFFFFIGQESPLQQHDIAVFDEVFVEVKANATIPSHMTMTATIVNMTFFFMITPLLFRNY
jgi:hypothetical protein